MEEPLLINHAGKQFFPWMNWLVLGLDYRLDLVQLLEVKWVKEKLMGLLVVIEAGITDWNLREPIQILIKESQRQYSDQKIGPQNRNTA